MPVAPHIFDAQHLMAGAGGAPLEDVGEIPPDHETHDLGVIQFGRRLDGNEAPVAQDRHPVAELKNLLDAVRHIDDGHAFVAQTPDEGKEALDLIVRERGGRLVEGKHTHARLEGAHDFDDLALGGRELVAEEIHGQDALEAIFSEAAAHQRVEPAAIEQTETLGQLADPDVLGDVDAGDDLRLLIDDANAGMVGGARVGKRDLTPVQV